MDFSSRDALEVVPSTSSDKGGGETRNGDLTLDLIIDIFARLPVKSLFRFKCISKFCYSLIRSPNFISMHSAHCQTVTFFNPGIRTTATTLSFQHLEEVLEEEEEEEDNKELKLSRVEVIEDVEMVGCFNGVVCLSLSPLPQKYALWNPATRQLRRIGRAPMDGLETTNAIRRDSSVWYGSVFCFDPMVTNVFKVAQIKLTIPEAETEAASEVTAQVNVFSSATTSWKTKNIVVPFWSLGSGFLHAGEAPYVNGYIHWHVGWTYTDMYILTYNMSNEVFQRTEMPSHHAFVNYRLTSYKGSLAMFAHAPAGSNFYDEVDVWVLNDSGGASQSWSKILSCKPFIKLTRVVGFFWKDGIDFILMYNNRDNSYYLCDPRNGETKMLLTRGSIWQTFPYNESFVSLY